MNASVRLQRSWSWILKNIVLPAGDLAMGAKMMRRAAKLREAQWWDRERLHAERDRALADVIDIAYREVPLYRDLMIERGLSPGDVRKPEHLRRLPAVTKDMFRAAFPDRCVRATPYKQFDERTSGSTGKNFKVRSDSETESFGRASVLLALEWAGWNIGEPHVQTGMTLKRGWDRRLKDALLRCYYVSAYDLTDNHLDESLNLIEHHRVQHLWGYPGSLYMLARRAIERGWNLPMQSLATWGDNLFPHYRQSIETAFAGRVIDTYGCAEGIQVSAQCERGTYHVHTLDTIVECVDDDDADVAPDQRGNLILTRLYAGPMPLIRYRVGDVGIMGSNERCACGRGFDTMSSVQGRDTDLILTPSGNRLIVHFFTGTLEHFDEIDSFQVVQEELERIIVRVVPAKEITAETRARMVKALVDRGADLKIEIEEVAEIPVPPSGKRRFVLSTLSKARDAP